MWLKNHIEHAIKPLFNKNSAPYYKMLFYWDLIVGDDLKYKILPQDIKFSKNKINTLTVKIDNHCNILKIQMMIPNIIDKITRYFGYKIISKIKIIGLNTKLTKDHIDKPKKTTSLNSLSKENDILLSINKNPNKEMKKILTNIAQNLQ
ncbi:MAG: DciA family protein [Candidatus Midichloriaceae bacterium]